MNSPEQRYEIEYNKVYSFDISGTYSFGSLPAQSLNDIFKDGRVASHLLEPQLELWFPELKHVKGCKGHDHIHRTDDRLFDAKNFTKNGCKFMPSNMIGSGRKFDEEVFIEKVKDMSYIVCDIVEFPKIRVVFKEGVELARQYMKGAIPLSGRKVVFCEES
jgi:hypothetical protein|tara:strand:- start:2563 stop:3045 length:483 start_codon:yes stop_codon:yes gene_type:complete